jgi:hypothetical protein
LGNLKERNHLEDLGIDGSVIFKRILNKQDGRAGYMSQDTAKWRSVVNTAELSGSIKCGVFLI